MKILMLRLNSQLLFLREDLYYWPMYSLEFDYNNKICLNCSYFDQKNGSCRANDGFLVEFWVNMPSND